MADLYNTVKKQGEQIDDLQKNVSNHTTRIETLETQAKAIPPQPPVPPSEVKVIIPDEIARKSAIEDAINKIVQTLKTNDRQCSPEVSVMIKPMEVVEKIELDKKLRAVVAEENKELRKELADNGNHFRFIKESLSKINSGINYKNRFYACVGLNIFMVISMIVAIVTMFKQDDKIEHLTRVEWLYRWSRIGRTDTEDYQDFERRMLFGKKEEREGMKTKIFNMERNAPQFLYFNPTDDWKPKPPKPDPKQEQKEQSPKPKNSSTQPSKQKSNLTPGEIEAIKALRANPHIPEDAKPPLPEGY